MNLKNKNFMRASTFSVLTLTVLFGGGCIIKSTDNFSYKNYLPPTAKDVAIQDIDFQGDGKSEKVVTYTNSEVIDRNKQVTTQYIIIFEKKTDIWKSVAQDVFKNDEVQTPTFLLGIEKIDFSRDGKEDAVIRYQSYRGDEVYAVLTYFKNQYLFLDPPSVTAVSYNDDYLKLNKEEKEYRSLNTVVSEKGVDESYAIFCEKDMRDKPQVERYAVSCRNVEFRVSLEDGVLHRKNKNKEVNSIK